MPSLLQLQAEPWWNAERVTPEVTWLGDQLCARTGRPRSAFGTKGDELHMKGAHRSQRWILNSVFCTNRTYTVQSGLTEAQKDEIAGIDFTPGSGSEMITQSRRIYNAMRAGLLNEVREFYGNIDGDQVVDGWDNIDDEKITSDASHLWHWHLTLDRKQLHNMDLMRRILSIVLGETMTLTPAQETQLLGDTAQARSLLHDGKRGGGLAETAGGGVPIAYLPRMFHEVHSKLDAALREIGRMHVEMATLKNEILAIKTAVDAIPTGGETVLTLEPVTLSGELRFNDSEA